MVGVLTSCGLGGVVKREWPVHSIYDVIDAVREMPGIFIGAPNLTLLHGYLLGFDSSCHAFDNPLGEPILDFQRFHGFVARHLNRSSSELGWRDLLLEVHGDESAAYSAFFELLDAFREEGS